MHKEEDDTWAGLLPVYETDRTIIAFATCHYQGVVSLSTFPVRWTAEGVWDVPLHREPMTPLEFPLDPLSWWNPYAGTDLIGSMPRLVSIFGADGNACLTLEYPHGSSKNEVSRFAFATNWVSQVEAKRSDPDTAIEFRLRWRRGTEAVLKAFIRPQMCSERSFAVPLDLEVEDDIEPGRPEVTRKFRFVASDLRDTRGNPLQHWRDIDRLSIEGSTPIDCPPVLEYIRWCGK